MNVFTIANSVDPGEMPRSVAFHLGLHCFSKNLLTFSLSTPPPPPPPSQGHVTFMGYGENEDIHNLVHHITLDDSNHNSSVCLNSLHAG